MSAGSPFFSSAISAPGAGGDEGSTNMSFGSTVGRPDVAELVLRIPLAQDDAHRRVWRGEAKRFVKRPRDLRRFLGRLPLAVDRREASRVQHAASSGILHLEEVLAEVRAIDRLLRIARPLERLDHDAIDAEDLLLGVAGVEVVDAQRPGRLGRDRNGEDSGCGDKRAPRVISWRDCTSRVGAESACVSLRPDVRNRSAAPMR